MLSSSEVEIFLAAAEAQNFSGAARKLHLTQPAVSRQIKVLERRLRVELFERKGGRAILTEAGRSLLPLAQELVNLSVQIQENVASRRGVVTGHLTIGCTTTPGKYVLPHLAGAFCRQYPEVRVAVEVMRRSDLPSKLQKQELNFGIMSGRLDNPDLIFDELMEDELVLVAPKGHPLLQEPVAQMERLRDEVFVLREEQAGTRLTMEEGLAQAGLSLDEMKIAPIVLGAAEGVVAAVDAGCGISWVSRIAARQAVDLGRIGIVEVQGLRLQRTVYLVSQRTRVETTAQRKFRDFVLSSKGQTIIAERSGSIQGDQAKEATSN